MLLFEQNFQRKIKLDNKCLSTNKADEMRNPFISLLRLRNACENLAMPDSKKKKKSMASIIRAKMRLSFSKSEPT